MANVKEQRGRFAYQPLPVVENEVHIRLLILQPGFGDEISGKLIHNVSTRSKRGIDYHTSTINYEALSYMWGPPKISNEILLDGQRFPVRENLYWALQHLRLKDQERTIWIDAICINQDDVEEKNVQVAQMGVVYMGSKKTVVWLGKEELGLGESACDVILGMKQAQSRKFWLDLVERWNARPEGDEGKSVREWYVLLKLVQLDYWKRLWIMQEVVLGYAVELYWGTGILGWETIKSVFTGISDVEDDKEIGLEFQKTSRALTETVLTRLIRQKYGGGKVNYFGRNDIFTLLSEYQEAGCFDLRDKVYGMNGISIQQIPVDYSKTAAEICQRVLSDRFSLEPNEFESRLKNTKMHRFEIFDIVSKGEFLYKLLRESNLRPEDAEATSSQELETKIIPVGCNISGDVCFASETLDTYRGLSFESVTELLSDHLHHVTMTQHITMQLEYLSHLVEENSDLLSKVLGNPDANRCYPISQTSSYGEEPSHGTDQSPYENWEKAQAMWEKTKEAWKEEHEERSHVTFSSSSQLRQGMVANLISAAASSLDLRSSKQTKIFFSNSGLIGFAPGNTSRGDVICTFRESRTLLIMRRNQEKGNFAPIGVASSFSRDLDNDSKFNVRAGMMNYDQVPKRLMWLFLDVRVLQLLCSFDCMHSSDKTSLFKHEEGVRRGLNPWGNFLQP